VVVVVATGAIVVVRAGAIVVVGEFPVVVVLGAAEVVVVEAASAVVVEVVEETPDVVVVVLLGPSPCRDDAKLTPPVVGAENVVAEWTANFTGV
jgi:hypothetical protein